MLREKTEFMSTHPIARLIVTGRRALHQDQVAGRATRPVARALVPLVLLLVCAGPAAAAVNVSITVAPPALPLYVQSPCPGDGHLWTPGYWA